MGLEKYRLELSKVETPLGEHGDEMLLLSLYQGKKRISHMDFYVPGTKRFGVRSAVYVAMMRTEREKAKEFISIAGHTPMEEIWMHVKAMAERMGIPIKYGVMTADGFRFADAMRRKWEEQGAAMLRPVLETPKELQRMLQPYGKPRLIRHGKAKPETERKIMEIKETRDRMFGRGIHRRRM